MPAKTLFFIAALSFYGCASTTAPPRWLPTSEQAAVQSYGGWAEITMQDKAVPKVIKRIEGELIALDFATIYILPKDTSCIAISRPAILKAKVMGYDPHEELMVAGTFGGTLSTLSHGWLLILTAPAWLITGIPSTIAQSYEGQESYTPEKQDQWKILSKYARFPQGLPEGLDITQLKPKLVPPASNNGIIPSLTE